MEKVEVKTTWRLAWGIWWRLFLISLGIWAIVGGISFAAGAAYLVPYFGVFGG